MRRATQPAAWLCSRRGLPYLPRCRRSGGLLPHHFTLTGYATPCRTANRRSVFCGTVCRPRRNAHARELPGTLLFGARTFLRAHTARGDDQPASSNSYDRRSHKMTRVNASNLLRIILFFFVWMIIFVIFIGFTSFIIFISFIIYTSYIIFIGYMILIIFTIFITLTSVEL